MYSVAEGGVFIILTIQDTMQLESETHTRGRLHGLKKARPCVPEHGVGGSVSTLIPP